MKEFIILTIVGLLLCSTINQNIIIRNPGCNSYDSSGVCQSCSTRFYKDINNICQPVNPNCKTYDSLNGDCLSCYSGFGLIQGTCLPGLDSQVIMDPNCNKFDNDKCVKCSYGYYFNNNNVCTKADPSCQTFDQNNGACTSCYSGFSLNSGRCIRQVQKITDTNCNQFSNNGTCIKCSSGYYFKQGLCTKIDDSCKEFDLVKSSCVTCYTGYSLNSNYACIKDAIKQNSDPNCAQWKDNVCLTCSKGSIFNNAGVCIPLDSNCQSHDLLTGNCKSCYSGYQLSNGKCSKLSVQTITDSNCNQFNANGQCLKCSTGYYFNDLKVCTKIDDSCKVFSIAKRACLQCYSGYQLTSSNTCVKVVQDVADANCAQWNGKICTKCSFGSAFNNQGVCVILDSQCKQYNQITNVCKACYAGYELNSQNVCVKSAVQNVKDPLCAEWNGDICTKCSVGSYFGLNKICILIDSSCKSANKITGECLSCYDGYQLNSSKVCVAVVQKVADQNCAEWKGKVCTKCSFGSVFNNLGKCTTLDTQCKQYDELTGICENCYQGYQLNNLKICIRSAIKNVQDTLCSEWTGQICTKCSPGSFFSTKGICTQIDPSCRAANPINGNCIGCYDGYQLNSVGSCQKVVQQVSDINCAEWVGKSCKKCSVGSTFNTQGRCIIVDSQCRQFDKKNNVCKSCYQGYELNPSKLCIQSLAKEVKDLLCAEWNGDTCVRCSPGSYYSSAKICTLIDSSCKSSNKTTGVCLSCYDGYKLSSSKTCVKVVQDVADANCAQWNGKICTKCSFGSAFNNQGVCVILDSQCKQYNQVTNVCKACYAGYELNSLKVCVKSAVQNVKDSLCAEWNGDLCTKCSLGSYLNKNGLCTQVDSSCQSFNKLNGDCLSCYSGYALSSTNKCIQFTKQNNQNPLCARWQDKICIQCSSGSFFNGLGTCQPIDPLCKTSNLFSGACTSCFDGYKISGTKCVVSHQDPRDPLCAQFQNLICKKCSFGAYFNSKGICQISDSSCQSFDKVSGVCKSCYPGYILLSGKCQIDKTYTISDPFCASFQDSICLKCAKGYYFQKDGKCTAVDTLCATYNELNGKCLSCFDGYQLQSGFCIKAKQVAKDPNCASFKDNLCTECSQGFIFNSLKLCVLINPLCKTFDKQTGGCTSCYTGYVVKDTNCVVDTSLNESNCAQFVDGICMKCASRSFLNSKGSCQKVSESCRTYSDLNGQCLSCYSGFTINKGVCIEDQIKGGCAQLDSNGNCVKCGNGYYINSGKCILIDTQCAKFNLGNKICQGCYSGYTLLQGKCQISKVNQQFQVKNCVAYNTDNKCIQCFDRFYLSNNQCKQVSVFCKTYDLITGACTGCYSTFKLTNGQCKQ